LSDENMSHPEIEAAAVALSAEEQVQLVTFLTERLRKDGKGHMLASRDPGPHSVRDIQSVSLGQPLKPLGTREEWHDEMLEDRV
jgi:hypothetical protein